MHQSSLLKFFAKNVSNKDTNNPPKQKDISKPKLAAKPNIKIDKTEKIIKKISDDSPVKISRKRKALLDSDSGSDKSSPQKLKISKTEENDEKAIETTNTNDESFETTLITNPIDYDPSKTSYHIVNDACWLANEKVPYLALTKTFEIIESEKKRLEITKILSNFLRSVIYLSQDDLLACIYLCLNKVSPDYEGLQFGIGEKVIMKALNRATDTNMNTLTSKKKTCGDLGQVAFSLSCNQTFMKQPTKLTVAAVFQKFKEIANKSGKMAQNDKIGMIKMLLEAGSKWERKFIIKSLLGSFRIGLAEQTVLAALGQAVTLTPPNKTKLSKKSPDLTVLKPEIDSNTSIIKTAFCEYPNYNVLIQSILEYGVANLSDHCSICPSVPIKPMLAHPSKEIGEIFERFSDANVACEYKYDGERAQIHVYRDNNGKRQVKIFSRNQENNTAKYPDIVSLIDEMMSRDGNIVETCIIDSEAVAWNRDSQSILPFQVLSTRKRKDVDEEDIKIQVCIYAFDLIYFNGQSLLRKSLRDRRNILREHFIEKPGKFMFSTSLDSNNVDDIAAFLDQSILDKCEGLMIKTLDQNATYEISKRSHNWLKLKKDYVNGLGDSVDVVVIGAKYGDGKRSNKYGTFLVACYDPESQDYQAICKLGSGISDELLETFYAQFKEIIIPKPLINYKYEKSNKMDCWFEPRFVWEIKAADLTISPDYQAAIGLVQKDKGISLRFPRLIRIREDKTPEMATTSRQIANMYYKQDNKTNEKKTYVFEDDEFY